MTPAARVAFVAVAVALFLGSWVAIHHLWYRSAGQIVDTPVYQRYGDLVASGALPYRDFSLEYPPGALAPFLAPELTVAARDRTGYAAAFDRWMAGAGVALVVLAGVALAALDAPPGRTALALLLVGVSPLLLGNVLLSRFDLWPAALTTGALAALLARRDALGALVLGAAIAAKLYPAVLVPLGIAWVWRRRGGFAAARWTALVTAVCAAVFLPFAALGPAGLGHSFGVQLGRPLQVESLGAAVLVALHHVAGLAVHMHTDHGSQNLEGGGAGAVAAATTALAALALATVWGLFARGPARRERLATAAAASVVAFVAFGKVLSPQFLVWLLPLVPLVRSRLAQALLVAALLLTQVEFPQRYWDYALAFRPFVSWIVLARDLVLVALGATLLRALLPQPERDPYHARLDALARVRAQPD